MKPLFEIGQEVIIVTSDGVISNGNHIVIKKEITPAGNHHYYSSGIRYGPSSWAYNVTNDLDSSGIPWAEENLRPKPKGTGKSYTEFMNELKKDKVVTI